MLHGGVITENQLDEWVRNNAQRAQGVIVELVWRLVVVSSSKLKERRFPLRDSIGQHGPDGVLDTEHGYDPFVPEGRSYWEIGSSLIAGKKATSDYRDLVKVTPKDIRQESTFVFVTPLSGRRDWEYTWKSDAQARWLDRRRKKQDWRDVRIIDGTGLIDWLHHFPAIEVWLATEMGLPVHQIQTTEQRWAELRNAGDPFPLIPELFLSNRDEACVKLEKIFSGAADQLQLATHFPDHVADFVAAYVAHIDEDARAKAVGRCLIISGTDAWNEIASLQERHILVADYNLEQIDMLGARMLLKAHSAGHAVIYSVRPDGHQRSDRVSMPNPTKSQMQEALEKSGYNEERARVIAQKSNGNIGYLIKYLQDTPITPEWARGAEVADLAIAELIGSWSEKYEVDHAVIKDIAGKSYIEWVAEIRKVAFRQSTPLILQNDTWKFVARYEGWYALGSMLFNEHLDRFKVAAIEVLRERDPKFDLPPEERFVANIYGKVLLHSGALRKGVAESLALLGSHPQALTACSRCKSEDTASIVVREALADADWVVWASLNDLLPLLAEASPKEFLDAVDGALGRDPCPFDTLFAQEGSGIMCTTYVSGLLWALETLAWDPVYLVRVVNLLGELAARDPGGSYTNRPSNSLTTILLPWLPQTCAPVAKRKVAIETLINEQPNIAWNLLRSLLPQRTRATSGSCRPVWREIIPEDWAKGVTRSDYWEQVGIYTDLMIGMAKSDIEKLVDIVDHYHHLLSPAQEQLLAHLNSSEVISLPEVERLALWNKLENLIAKHRKYEGASWTLKPEQVDTIALVSERLEPKALIYRHQRLFNESSSDLHEEKGNYKEQQKKLENRRQEAVMGIYKEGGVQGVIEFAKTVESPWQVGLAFGALIESEGDLTVLPELLTTDQKALTQLAGGYVVGRFQQRGWEWVDELDVSRWQPIQTGQFLTYLPFTSDTWKRVKELLSTDESPYWIKTHVNPFEVGNGLEYAVDHLIEHGRPLAAIGCIRRCLDENASLDTERAVRALLIAPGSLESINSRDAYEVTELIKALQNDARTNLDDLCTVEGRYLSLLNGHLNVTPITLEQRLADDPNFFCDIVRMVFRSNKGEGIREKNSEDQKRVAEGAYQLLHKWRTVPGTQRDGMFDGNALISWVEQVLKECEESGHTEIAQTMIGQVLIHAPPDPEGLWIHQAAAKILNAKNAQNMREGFITALYNSRGAHFSSAGKEELALAEKYLMKAEEIEDRGYQRLAASLRDLAPSYKRDAEWISGSFND